MTDVRELYPEVAAAVRPVILFHARKISMALSLPMDDAIQEVSMALYRGMQGYDFNRSHGGIHAYADVILRNCAASIITSSISTTCCPHVVYREDGKLKVAKRSRLASLDELTADGDRARIEPCCDDTPEDAYTRGEMQARRAKLKMRLVNKLTERERAIFKCLTQPAEGFLMFLRNIGLEEPTHAAVARYLGLGKNAVDYSAFSIRTKFTKLAEAEFPDLIEGYIERGTWPMIHVSREPHPDHEFCTRVIRERGLDPRPTEPARDIEMAGDWAREIHNYPWGVVLIIKRGAKYRTMVIEGRFNKLSGGVSGADGTWKNVSGEVPWYPKLVRELTK